MCCRAGPPEIVAILCMSIAQTMLIVGIVFHWKFWSCKRCRSQCQSFRWVTEQVARGSHRQPWITGSNKLLTLATWSISNSTSTSTRYKPQVHSTSGSGHESLGDPPQQTRRFSSAYTAESDANCKTMHIVLLCCLGVPSHHLSAAGLHYGSRLIGYRAAEPVPMRDQIKSSIRLAHLVGGRVAQEFRQAPTLFWV
jgi:hypothetical protein